MYPVQVVFQRPLTDREKAKVQAWPGFETFGGGPGAATMSANFAFEEPVDADTLRRALSGQGIPVTTVA